MAGVHTDPHLLIDTSQTTHLVNCLANELVVISTIKRVYYTMAVWECNSTAGRYYCWSVLRAKRFLAVFMYDLSLHSTSTSV